VTAKPGAQSVPSAVALLPRRRFSKRTQFLASLRLETLGQFVKHVQRSMVPAPQLRGHQGLIGWRCKRGDAPAQFAADIQRLAAGGQDLEVRAVTQQRVRQRGAACQHVLAVVEDQEYLAWAEVIDRADTGSAPGESGTETTLATTVWATSAASASGASSTNSCSRPMRLVGCSGKLWGGAWLATISRAAS
jgi:hypothetical protein